MVALAILIPSYVQADIIRVEAYIDGRSLLTIRGDTAKWHHINWDAPGRWQGANYATVINGQNWFPTWPDSPNASNTNCNCDSKDEYSGINPPLSLAAQTVIVNNIQARNSISILQQPAADNDYNLIIDFNDNPVGGPVWYIIELQVTVPGTLQFSAPTYIVNENDSSGSATIKVTRTGGSNGAVGVSYATSNETANAGSDYTATSGTLSWANGDTSNKTFSVPITDDGVYEGNETLNLILKKPKGGATLGSPNTAVLTILNSE